MRRFLVPAIVVLLLLFSRCVSRRPAPEGPREPDGLLPSKKADLWTGGTKLRGANLWQKRIESQFDGDSLGTGAVGPPYTDGDLGALAKLGANYVNLSHPGLFTETPPYHLDEAVAAHLDRLLERLEKADLFVVLSFRTGPGRNEAGFDSSEKRRAVHTLWKDAKAQEAWVAMWKATAERYRGRTAIVGYNLMVEPNANAVVDEIDDAETFFDRHGGGLSDFNPLAERLITAVRSVDAETPVLVPGQNYSHVDWLSRVRIPDGGRPLVAVAHFYEPYNYTHQTGRTLTLRYPGTQPLDDGPRTIDAAWLEGRLAPVVETKRRLGIPVMVGEFGVMRWEPGAVRYLDDVTGVFEKLGVNHAVWLWESGWKGIEYDQFNYRKGVDRRKKTDDPQSPLTAALARAWRKNDVRLGRVKGRW